MNENEQLYIERHTRYAHLTVDAQAAATMAYDKQFSYDSMRGRISLGNTPRANLELAKQASMLTPDELVSIERQQVVIATSQKTFDNRVEEGEQAVLTLADPHLPYTRWDAVELAMMIQNHIQARYVTVGHDLIDNNGYGRWPDLRSPSQKVWSSDVQNIRTAEQAWYRMLKGSSPSDVMLLELLGNHDVWLYSHMRQNEPQSAEKTIADYIEWKFNQGVLVFSNGRENFIEMSPNLVLWHGQAASKSAQTNAKNTIEQFMQNGIARTVVVGHTHRSAAVSGENVGYPGVNFYNAPCMSRLTDIPYMKKNPIGWGLGVNVVYFVPGTRYERGYNILFYERGGYLQADFNGIHYQTKLDKNVAK